MYLCLLFSATEELFISWAQNIYNNNLHNHMSLSVHTFTTNYSFLCKPVIEGGPIKDIKQPGVTFSLAMPLPLLAPL